MAGIVQLNNAAKIGLVFASVVFTFYTIVYLMLFLSYPNYERFTKGGWSLILFYDTLLISLFAGAHSFLAHPKVKNVFERWHLMDVQRCIYNIITCSTLQAIFYYWQCCDEYALWRIDPNNKTMRNIYLISHLISWLVIYSGSICMDINELLGIKQVYYSLQNLPDPIGYKSFKLQQLYVHMRHPSFLGFLIIFWVTPIMSIDRLLLALLMTIYMLMAWRTTDVDYSYQMDQFNKKFIN